MTRRDEQGVFLNKTEAHAIVEALRSDAEKKRRESKLRANGGEQNIQHREVLRINANYNEQLAANLARQFGLQ